MTLVATFVLKAAQIWEYSFSMQKKQWQILFRQSRDERERERGQLIKHDTLKELWTKTNKFRNSSGTSAKNLMR